ncbi:MAG: glycosyltransferase [Chloroflexi bacterium]|nr:glycosyltransferase [Chloroflexota bacterium]
MTALQFSIIVPTYNRPSKLGDCLDSLSQMDYPRECFEVIVVDDGGQADVTAVVAPFQKQMNLTLLCTQTNTGPAAARNYGAAHAVGDYLAFTDDDCRVAPDWLHRFSDRLTESPMHIIGGRTVNALTCDPYATTSHLLLDYLYDYAGRTGSRAVSFFVSNNFAVAAALFREIGGFDESMCLVGGEDREFCDRWLHNGYSLTYTPEGLVYHAHHLKWRSFWQQHFIYGQGAFQFHRARARRTRKPIRLEPLAFYLNLFRFPFEQKQPQSAVLLILLLFVSQAANASGFYYRRIARAWAGG